MKKVVVALQSRIGTALELFAFRDLICMVAAFWLFPLCHQRSLKKLNFTWELFFAQVLRSQYHWCKMHLQRKKSMVSLSKLEFWYQQGLISVVQIHRAAALHCKSDTIPLPTSVRYDAHFLFYLEKSIWERTTNLWCRQQRSSFDRDAGSIVVSQSLLLVSWWYRTPQMIVHNVDSAAVKNGFNHNVSIH